jgi:hypothetical protein
MSDDTFSGLSDLLPSPLFDSSDEWEELSLASPSPSREKRAAATPPLTPERPGKRAKKTKKTAKTPPPTTPPAAPPLERAPALVRADAGGICQGEWVPVPEQIYVPGQTRYVLKPRYSGYIRNCGLFATFARAGPKRGLNAWQQQAEVPFSRVARRLFSGVETVGGLVEASGSVRDWGFVSRSEYSFEAAAAGGLRRWTLAGYTAARVNFDFYRNWGGPDGGEFGELSRVNFGGGGDMLLGEETILVDASLRSNGRRVCFVSFLCEREANRWRSCFRDSASM